MADPGFLGGEEGVTDNPWIWERNPLLSPANEVWGKVMFSQVCLSTGGCLPLGPRVYVWTNNKRVVSILLNALFFGKIVAENCRQMKEFVPGDTLAPRWRRQCYRMAHIYMAHGQVTWVICHYLISYIYYSRRIPPFRVNWSVKKTLPVTLWPTGTFYLTMTFFP